MSAQAQKPLTLIIGPELDELEEIGFKVLNPKIHKTMPFRNSRHEYMALSDWTPESPGSVQNVYYQDGSEMSLWGQIANLSKTSCGTPEPKAIKVAHEIQREVMPLATILFGSRSRGDYKTTSDIDLLLVYEDDMLQNFADENEKTVNKIVMATYGRSIEIGLKLMTMDKYLWHTPYRNTYVTEALLHGMVFGIGYDGNFGGNHYGDSKEFVSCYALDDAPPPKYQWDLYLHYSRCARDDLRSIQVYHRGVVPPGHVNKKRKQKEEDVARIRHLFDHEEIHRSIVKHSYDAIQFGLATFHVAHNKHTRDSNREMSIPKLIRTWGKILEDRGLSTRIPLERYADPQFLFIIPQDELVKSVIHDVTQVKRQANKIKWEIDSKRRKFERSPPPAAPTCAVCKSDIDPYRQRYQPNTQTCSPHCSTILREQTEETRSMVA